MIFMLFRLLIVLSVTLVSQWVYASDFEIANDKLSILFRVDGSRFSFSRFYSKETSTDVIGGASTFFRIDYVDKSGAKQMLFSHSDWSRLALSSPKADQLLLEFEKEPLLKLRFLCTLSGSALSCSSQLSNINPDIKINQFHFPYIEIDKLSSKVQTTDLLYPQRSGRLEENILSPENKFSYSQTYPSAQAPIPLTAIYNNDLGIYVATHDPIEVIKKISLQNIVYPTHRRFLIDYAWQIENQTKNIDIPGVQVFQAFKGDWFDAAQIYKTWAMQKRPDRFAKRISPEILNTAFWLSDDCTKQNGCLEHLPKLARELSVPLALHWYNWHHFPFDKNYPHYFPAKEGFAELVAGLKKAGISIMPYINALQWDRQLEDFPESDAVKDQKGQMSTFPGSTLTAMCPTSQIFRNTLIDVIGDLFKIPGINGVYFDQMAAVAPYACHNPNHGHPVGAGHWWYSRGYDRLISDSQKTIRSDSFITSEWVNEHYVGKLDGLLTNNFADQGQVPMFNAIYNEAVTTFGRFHWKSPDGVKVYRMKIGQSLVYGNQLGWLSASLLEDANIRNMSIGLAKLRHRFRDFFSGVMKRPPSVVNRGEVEADWFFYWHERKIKLPKILSGRFQNKKNEEISVLVNISEEKLSLGCSQSIGRKCWKNVEKDIAPVLSDPLHISLEPGQALVCLVEAAYKKGQQSCR